jgi:hypothetical protein
MAMGASIVSIDNCALICLVLTIATDNEFVQLMMQK